MKVFVVIDEGCQECGVESVPIGIFLTESEAQQASKARWDEFEGWRDGGQSGCCIYEMEVPAGVASPMM